MNAEQIVNQDIIMNASMLVDYCLSTENSVPNTVSPISWDDVQNYGEDEDGEYPEPLEWWFISSWLADKLDDQNEVLINSDQGWIWGRQTSGQAISMDYVIEKIAKSI